MVVLLMFVCYFKQKTAYEMRISDWSSDVCSSDLQGAADHRRAQDLQGADRRGHDGQCHALLFGEPGAARGQGGCDLRFAVRRPPRRQWLQRDAVDRRHPADLLQLCLRSGEHTSEPQSLMRTSYAVSCLKNKHQNSSK